MINDMTLGGLHGGTRRYTMRCCLVLLCLPFTHRKLLHLQSYRYRYNALVTRTYFCNPPPTYLATHRISQLHAFHTFRERSDMFP